MSGCSEAKDRRGDRLEKFCRRVRFTHQNRCRWRAGTPALPAFSYFVGGPQAQEELLSRIVEVHKKKIIKAQKETADKQNEVKRGHRERQPVPKGQHAKSPAYSHRGQGSGTAEVDRSFGELGWPTNGKADRPSSGIGRCGKGRPSAEEIQKLSPNPSKKE